MRDITTITADDVAQSVTISMTEADTNLAGTAQGMHVFTVTAKSTGGVTMNPVVTAEITLRTWYSTCKGANIVSSVNAFTPKEILLNAADETQLLNHFVTDPVACASLLVLSAVAPSAANNAAAGVDIIETESPYGLTITYKQIASDKTAVVGTHDFTISAVDWWGNTNTNTLTAKLLISDADCENKDTLTLTYNGNDAATYNLGDAAAEFPYSVTALVPDYCHYTIASTLIPGGISAHLTDDATNDKYLMAKVEGPGSLAGAYEVQATASTLHGKAVDLSDKLWKKTITVVDPCAADVLTYTATAPTDAEY